MQPQVSAQDAADLYRAMVEDLYISFDHSGDFNTIVYFTPESQRSAFKNWLGSGVSLKNQCDGNLVINSELLLNPASMTGIRKLLR